MSPYMKSGVFKEGENIDVKTILGSIRGVRVIS